MCLKNLNEIRKNIPEGKLSEADVLISHAVGRNRAFVLAHPEYRPNLWQSLKISKYLKKFLSGRPIAYITGHKEFYGLDFFVNKYTLIPRPETEMIVSLALEHVKSSAAVRPAVHSSLLIDVGTGTGCIPVAIVNKLKHTNLEIKALAADISHRALQLARKNASLYQADIKFFYGNLLEPIMKEINSAKKNQRPILVTANLPYLTHEQFIGEPSISREPKIALVADNETGLSLYENLFQQASKAGVSDLTIIAEIDPRQSALARNLAEKYFPNSKIEIKKDLSQNDRVLVIETKAN